MSEVLCTSFLRKKEQGWGRASCRRHGSGMRASLTRNGEADIGSLSMHTVTAVRVVLGLCVGYLVSRPDGTVCQALSGRHS